MKIGFKIETKKIVNFFKKIPRTVGEHFFLSFLIVTFIAFILGGLIFYRYIFVPKNAEVNILESPVFFNVDIYKKVLEELQNREQTIQELNSKQYSNPFQIPAPVPNETIPG